MTSPDNRPPRASRSPAGINGKPLYLSLAPAERERVEALARREQRTLSATARLLLLRGLQAQEQAPDTSLAS